MEREMIGVFHKWSEILWVTGVCGAALVIVLFWKFRYSAWCMEWILKRRLLKKSSGKKQRLEKWIRNRMAFFAAVVFLSPAVLTLAAESTALQAGESGLKKEGELPVSQAEKITVDLEGDSACPNVYQDTAVAEITFYERNFDETGICVTVGDETGRETRISFENGEWLGLTGLGEGTLEIIPYETCWFWDSEEGLLEHTEKRTVKMRLRFLEEGRFEIREIVCRDLAGNLSELQAPVSVTVDRTPPELQIFLPEEELVHKGYYSHPVTVWLYLKEHNFEPEGTENFPGIILSKEKEGENGEGGEGSFEAVVLDGIWRLASEKGEDWYKFPVDVTEEGNYQLRVSYEDPAGWPLSSKSVTEEEFTVDMTAPEFGVITAMGESWNIFMEHITFGRYSSNTELVIFEGKDSVSPVEPLRYFCSGRELTEMELADLPKEQWKEGNSLLLTPDLEAVVYLKVTNYAGLDSYFNSEGLVIENKGPVITLSPWGEIWARSGIYRGNVDLTVSLEEPEETGVVSGLKQASYILEAERGGEREVLKEDVLLEQESAKLVVRKNWKGNIFLSAEEYDGETLWITVYAEDMAGNQSEKSLSLSFDQTEPKLQIIYGEEQPENGFYYNQERSVKLIIDEANFSEEQVWLMISNTDGTLPVISQWNHNGRIHSCQIVFAADGDYTFCIRCEDLAGHVTEIEERGFTIDRTPPEICVEFTEEGRSGNSQYYQIPRTAQVTFKEHNFSAGQVTDNISAYLDDGEKKIWKLENFDSRGDIHTASLSFSEDGDYHFRLEYTDLAGNRAKTSVEEAFSIDCTPPSIEILGLENESANRGNIEAEVCFQDKRLVPESVAVEVLRLDQKKKEGTYQYQESSGTGGEVIKRLLSESFPETEEADGLYLLRAAGCDLAGNQTEEERTFSVNRYGSVYVAAGETKAWLGAGEYAYLPEEREIVIREYNVDPVENFQVLLSRNGEISMLSEGKMFQRESLSENYAGSGWQIYEYRIKKEAFKLEGDYEIFLYSEDKAGNKMRNEAAKKEDRDVSFAFSVDKTGPSAVLSGGEDGGRYKRDRLELFLDVRDNMKLKNVEVRTGEEKNCYEGDNLDQIFTEEGLKIVLSGAEGWQTLELYAEDQAGNCLQLGNGRRTGAAGCMEWKFLVTSDRWVQFYQNPAEVVFLLLLAGGFLAAGIYLAVKRKQRRGKEKLRKEKHSKKKTYVVK